MMIKKRIVVGMTLLVAIGAAIAAFGLGLFRPASKPQSPNADDAMWVGKLAEAQQKLQQDPNSAFWHSQAAVAYDNLRNLGEFERGIRLARELDPANPIYHYMAYAVYKRRDMKSQRDEALKGALEADPTNPLGHFEMGSLHETRGDWNKALEEYKTTERLLQRALSGHEGKSKMEYVDLRANPFSLDAISQSLPEAIKRVTSHIEKH